MSEFTKRGGLFDKRCIGMSDRTHGIPDLETRMGDRGTDEWCDGALRDLAPRTAGDPATRRWWRRWVQSRRQPGWIKAMDLMNSEIDVPGALLSIRSRRSPLIALMMKTCASNRCVTSPTRPPGATFAELPGVDHGWWVDSGQIVAELKPFLLGLWKRGEWDMVETDRVLATVLFTDIANSTAMLAEAGDRNWRGLVEQHHALVRRQLVRYSGREIDTAGDGFFVRFDGPARAIRCARAISDGVRELGLHVRAGLHTGYEEVSTV